jgi:fructose-1-phosphate kinase PfkB-like protein
VFLEHALSSEPDVVKVNVGEAAQILESRTTNDDPVVVAMDLRRRAGGDGHAAVVTLGTDGTIAVDPDGRVFRGALDVRGRYSVGSGDAFLGGLLTALDADDPFGSALASALASGLGAAAAIAEVPGAGRLNAERARALSARARVETI